MRKLLLNISIFLLFTAPATSKTQYHKAIAREGDGVYSILRRYALEKYQCNHNEFYKINSLKKNSGIMEGKEYFIPILLYKYDNKSIRTSINNKNLPIAKKIEEFNENMVIQGLKNKSFKSDKVLWVPYHFFHCYKIEDSKKKENKKHKTKHNPPLQTEVPGIYPIFGPKYKKISQKDHILKGKIYYIVGGHAGPDPGAIGKRGKHKLCEDEYAYDVALRLARNLIEHDATVYVIVRDNNDGIRDERYLKCDKDEVVWGDETIPTDQRERLSQRAEIINELYEKNKKQGVEKQKLITIHIDSRSKRKEIDVFFYYPPESAKSKIFASKLHETLKAKYKKYRHSGEYFGTISERTLHMLTETKPESVYIELGNIKNSRDQLRFISKENRQALANWLAEGVINAEE